VNRPRFFRGSAAGYSFIELLVVTMILFVLASAAVPIARISIRRQQEAELRRALREMRTAIDQFYNLRGQIAQSERPFGSYDYPTSLDQLVYGVTMMNDQSGNRKKFLRRVPIDPMTGSTDWGKRSYQDEKDSKIWGGQNVFDVYSKAEGTALNGSKYKDW
jgi:general secretion pathway protein G